MTVHSKPSLLHRLPELDVLDLARLFLAFNLTNGETGSISSGTYVKWITAELETRHLSPTEAIAKLRAHKPD